MSRVTRNSKLVRYAIALGVNSYGVFMKKFSIPAKKIAIIIGVIAGLLVVVTLAGQFYKFSGGENDFLLKIVEKLDLDQERNNLPTWFQASSLLLCSFLLGIIALIRREIKDKDTRFWGIMALVFLYLSLDEAVSIHEQAAVPFRELFHAHGILFFGWVIPAIFLCRSFLYLVAKVSAKFAAACKWFIYICRRDLRQRCARCGDDRRELLRIIY